MFSTDYQKKISVPFGIYAKYIIDGRLIQCSIFSIQKIMMSVKN